MVVLDDGWFGKRDDDSSSLGDWIADIVKFPHGLKGLVEEINALGVRFGLWVEPEMVSEQSVSTLPLITNREQLSLSWVIAGAVHGASRLVSPCTRKTKADGAQPDGAGPFSSRCSRLYLQLPLDTLPEVSDIPPITYDANP